MNAAYVSFSSLAYCNTLDLNELTARSLALTKLLVGAFVPIELNPWNTRKQTELSLVSTYEDNELTALVTRESGIDPTSSTQLTSFTQSLTDIADSVVSALADYVDRDEDIGTEYFGELLDQREGHLQDEDVDSVLSYTPDPAVPELLDLDDYHYEGATYAALPSGRAAGEPLKGVLPEMISSGRNKVNDLMDAIPAGTSSTFTKTTLSNGSKYKFTDSNGVRYEIKYHQPDPLI